MALNVKPLWGLHYPSCHPEVTHPTEDAAIVADQEEEQKYGEELKHRQKLLQRQRDELKKKLILLDGW